MKIVKTTKSRDAETRSPQKSGIESKAKEDRLSVLYENAKSLAIDDVIELIYHPTENSDDDKVTVKHPYPEKKPLKPVLRKVCLCF
jgi:23S rRNA-/tRNA-specific pseudouridylate synthase